MRAASDSLIVGRNTMGSRQPLFWCCNASDSFAVLSDKLGSDQPVYGMRTLRNMEQNCEENVIKVAAHYATEILQLQPEGPYLLGGFCTGGKIAFEVAQHLIAAGREISLLCLQEIFVPKPFAAPVAMYFCSREHAGRHSPYRSYERPEIGWSKLYRGPYSVKTFDWRHREYYSEPNIDVFVAALAEDIESAQRQEESPLDERTPVASGLPMLPPEAYRAKIDVRVPWFLFPGEELTLRVHLTNAGSVTWLPTEASGIFLRDRWRSKVANQWLDGSSPLTKEISPGSGVKMELRVTAPTRAGRWRLYVDLVDEGVTWFQKMGSPSFRRVVFVIPASLEKTLRRFRVGRGSEAYDG